MRIKKVALIFAFTMCASAAISSHVINNVAPSGKRVLVTDMFWSGSDCQGADLTYELVSPPTHGTVTQRKAREKLSSANLNINPPARCEGKVIPISYVYYQSKKGFTGADSFTVRWVSVNGDKREKSYNLTVE
jgi:hypothetical protein